MYKEVVLHTTRIKSYNYVISGDEDGNLYLHRFPASVRYEKHFTGRHEGISVRERKGKVRSVLGTMRDSIAPVMNPNEPPEPALDIVEYPVKNYVCKFRYYDNMKHKFTPAIIKLALAFDDAAKEFHVFRDTIEQSTYGVVEFDGGLKIQSNEIDYVQSEDDKRISDFLKERLKK